MTPSWCSSTVLANSETDRMAWKRARAGLVTASDAAAILGMHPHKSRAGLLKDKVHPDFETELNTPAVRAGRFLEGGIFDWYLDDLKYYSAGAHGERWGDLLQSPVCPRLGATPDAWLDTGDGVPIIVEVKLHGANASERWGPGKYLKPRSWKDWFPSTAIPCFGEAPVHHWVQLQSQMHCAGVSTGVITGCLQGTARRDYVYPLAPWFIERLINEVQAFWEEVECMA